MTARRAAAWWLAAGILVATGIVLLVAASNDVQRSSAVAGDTPIRVVSAPGQDGGPVVVLAHGFSGSSAMMDPMASALARAGFVVVAPDLPGHGSNVRPLADGALDPAIGDAVEYAVGLGGVGPVAVIGHSMGAGAVTSWAVDNPALATVAISLPSAEDLPEDRALPANLLLLWGSAESTRFVDAALTGLQRGYPDAIPGQTLGDPGAGTARRAVAIAGAEHISVIYRQQTFEEVAAWLATGSGGPAPRGDGRLLGVLLVLVGGVVAARPLLARADGAGSAIDPAAPVGLARGYAVLAASAVVAGLGAAALQGLTDRVPVAVTGYLLGWFAVGAVGLILVARRRSATVGHLRGLGWGALAGVVVGLAMALPARLSWASYVLVGPRWWVLGVLLVVLGAWFWAESRVVQGSRGWRRAALLLGSRLIIVASLLAGIALLGAPGFLSLTVPLVVPILLLLAVLSGWARDPLAAGAAQSIPLALAMATTFPIVS